MSAGFAGHDRRQGDRRSSDRRRRDRRLPLGRRSEDFAPDTAIDGGWAGGGEGAEADSRFLTRRARVLAQSEGQALARIARTYTAARAAIGVALVLMQGLGSLLGARFNEGQALVAVAYAVAAIVVWLLPRFRALARPLPQARQRRLQWVATIGVDIVAFTLLHLLELRSSFNYAALLVLPVLMAGVLTSRLAALATAAAVSLLLLAVAWRLAPASADAAALMTQSGLAGLGLFIIALLAGELAGRLAREELAARDNRELARRQAQLNRLVIEEMADGVMVVDASLRVRAANPAARAMLVDAGLSPPPPFALDEQPAWAALAAAVRDALAAGDWPDEGRDVPLAFAAGAGRTLRLRVRFMRGRRHDARHAGAAGAAAAQDLQLVLLLEDLRTLQARIRQDRLAAMGRVSAGIAHEIRNPLAAIAQANALLAEDLADPAQRRLAAMVADNVRRLQRVVDDVLELAPGAPAETGRVDAAVLVAHAVAEWAHTAGVSTGGEGRLRLLLPNQPIWVQFDAEHLRRVLLNLLENAARHAGPEPGAMLLRLAPRGESHALLSVLSDGATIPADVERHLFEPFFSTRSRGTGLGLYICRELCERHGARIEYRPRPDAERLRNEFSVTLRRAAAT